MRYHLDFSGVLQPYPWLSALTITLTYAVGTILCGFVVGAGAGVLMLSRRRSVRVPVQAYVQFFRCTPLLVQMVWFYYALPILTGFSISAWIAAGLGLTLYMGAFCAEIFRAGVISIERGQWDAARALGLTHLRMMQLVILPQAARRMVPPIVSQSVLQLKNTSLLYVVAVPDLMYTSYEITAATYRPLEVYTFVSLIYFAILYPMTRFSKRLELQAHQ